MINGIRYPCGKCPNCLHNNREALANRFYFESTQNQSNYFITLTYDEENLPHFNGIPCFDKDQVRTFIKRLRNDLPQFKFFCTSEFGDRTARPHYHMLLFLRDFTPVQFVRDKIQSRWKFGHVTVTTANVRRFAYCAKYCLKENAEQFKLLDKDCPLRPFRLFSLRPGIGSSAIDYLNEYLYNGGNIRTSYKLGNQTLTFDNYIKRHIDPSIRAEIKALTYDQNFKDIQDKLAVSFLNNTDIQPDALEYIDDFGYKFKKKSIFVANYTKDKEIIKRRNMHKLLKKISL